MRNTHRRRGILITLGLSLALPAGCTSSTNKTNLESGFQSLREQQYDEALAVADKQIKETPSGAGAADAWYLRGRALEGRAANNQSEARANYVAARDAYHQALQMRPSSTLEAKIHAGLANVSYWLDDYSTALAEWTTAYPAFDDPSTRSYTLYRIGLCQQRLGQFAQADETFNKVERQFPGTDASEKAAKHRGYQGFSVQLATFQNAKTADAAVENLKRQGASVTKRTDSAGRTVISVGPTSNYQQAISLKNQFAGVYPDALIVP